MIKIGGNLTATVQKKASTKNRIGEGVPEYTTVGTVLGWLDYVSGDNAISQYRGRRYINEKKVNNSIINISNDYYINYKFNKCTGN